MHKRNYKEYLQILLITVAVALLTVVFSFAGQKISGENGIFSRKTSASAREKRVIVIDPGHGGEDGGAQSNDGTLEKNINLAISKYLEEYLVLTDVKTVMTRQDDRLLYNSGEENRKKFYDVRNRAAVAAENPECTFISIHQNKFPVPKYRGLQVYYSPNDPDSKILAGLIQENTKQSLQPENNREIKPSGSSIYVLYKVKSPAVLVECGFLSNSDETELLKSSEYQKKVAFVIFKSLMQYCTQK